MFALVCCLSLPILVERILKASFTLSHIYQLSCVLEMVDMAFKGDCKIIIDIVVYITHIYVRHFILVSRCLKSETKSHMILMERAYHTDKAKLSMLEVASQS